MRHVKESAHSEREIAGVSVARPAVEARMLLGRFG